MRVTTRDAPAVLKPVAQLFGVQLAIRTAFRVVAVLLRAVAGRQSRLGSHRCLRKLVVTASESIQVTSAMLRWGRDVVVWQWQ